jgi:hypothetical protein
MTGTSPMIKITGLWRHTSAKGTEYFVGRMAGAKVLIFENRDRKGEGDPTHHLFFAEPTPPAASTSPASHTKRPAARRRPGLYAAQQRSGSSPVLPADEVSDLFIDEAVS